MQKQTIVDRKGRGRDTFSPVFQMLPDAVLLVRATDGAILASNQAFTELSGHAGVKITGQPLQELPFFIDPELGEAVARIHPENGQVRRIQTRLLRKNGRSVRVRASLRSFDFDGQPCALISFQDLAGSTATHTPVDQERVEEALRVSEQKYRAIIENAPMGIFRSTLDGMFISVNPTLATMMGYDSPDELLQTCNMSTIHTVLYLDAETRNAMVGTVLSKGGWQRHENRYRRKDGRIITGSIYMRAAPNPASGRIELEGFVEDITERKRAEDELRMANLVVENSPVVLFRWKAEQGRPVEYVSGNVRQFGYLPEELLTGTVLFSSIVHPDDLETINAEVLTLSSQGADTFRQEYRILHGDGGVRWVEDRTMVERDGRGTVTHYQGIVMDITERKRAEEQVRSSLAEKEILLKEIHHRVKNNLQIISTLLDLQSGSIADERSRKFFRESQGRIRSMALVHEKLYQTRDFSQIDFQGYIESLTKYLFQTYVTDPGQVVLSVDAGAIALAIDDAIPCGLIINELVSNALKHAFPQGRHGEIKVGFQPEDQGWIVLTIADTGIGLSPDLDFSATETLGLQIVNTLARQLRGSVAVRNDHGAVFAIRFQGKCASDTGFSHERRKGATL